MRLALVLLAAVIAGCGFGLADDTGKPIPENTWGWACPDGQNPAPDAGCAAPPADAGRD